MGSLRFNADATLGEGPGAFVIAEAGVNHNGDLALAERLIDAAADERHREVTGMALAAIFVKVDIQVVVPVLIIGTFGRIRKIVVISITFVDEHAVMRIRR